MTNRLDRTILYAYAGRRSIANHLFSKLQLVQIYPERAYWCLRAQCDVLLYDLTSVLRLSSGQLYFESAPPEDENDKRRYGYSRDKRSDCVQVAIALIVTPDGFEAPE